MSILSHTLALAILALPVVLVGKAFFFASGRFVGYLDRTFLGDRNPVAERNAAWLVHLAGFLFVSCVLFLGAASVASGPAVSLFLILGGLFLALCATRLLNRLEKFLCDT